MAHVHLRGERSGHTLGTTALVHEAYIRLVDLRRVEWPDRVHFLSMAARAMRRILVDHARAHCAQRRGRGDWVKARGLLRQALDASSERNH